MADTSVKLTFRAVNEASSQFASVQAHISAIADTANAGLGKSVQVLASCCFDILY